MLVVALCPIMLALQVYLPASLISICNIVSVVMKYDETVDVGEIEMSSSVIDILLLSQLICREDIFGPISLLRVMLHRIIAISPMVWDWTDSIETEDTLVSEN